MDLRVNTKGNAASARRAEHGIYGLIVVLAVLVADDAASASLRVAIGTVIGAAFAASLAHISADYIGELIRAGRHPTWPEWKLSLRNAAFGFVIAVAPVAFLVLAASDAIALDTALDLAQWGGVALLGIYATAANVRAGVSLGPSTLFGLGFAVLGAALVALKVVL